MGPFLAIKNSLYLTLSMLRSEIAKPIKLLTVFLVLFAFVFSIAYSWRSMETIYHFQTKTALCPQSEMQTGCPMISKHLATVQGFLGNAVAPESRMALLILFVLSLLAIALLHVIFKRHLQSFSQNIRLCLYVLQRTALSIFSYLQLAFARGILNPKIY